MRETHARDGVEKIPRSERIRILPPDRGFVNRNGLEAHGTAIQSLRPHFQRMRCEPGRLAVRTPEVFTHSFAC